MNPPAPTQTVATIPLKVIGIGALAVGAVLIFVMRAKGSSSMGTPVTSGGAAATTTSTATTAQPVPYANTYSDSVVNVSDSAIGHGASYTSSTPTTPTPSTPTVSNPPSLPTSAPSPTLPQVPVTDLAGLSPSDPRKMALYSNGSWYTFGAGDTPASVATQFGTPFGWPDIANNPLNTQYHNAIYAANGQGGVPVGGKVWVP